MNKFMEFFTGNPQSVRGLGNILLDKALLDYIEYYSEVSVGQDSVFETVMPVYSMSYLDDSEGDMALPYDVNSFLLGAVKSVSVNDGKLDVNRYESSDLEVVTLRQLKHALSGKVEDITYVDNVLSVTVFERSDLFGLQTKSAIVSLLTNVVSDVRVVGNELVVERWSAADVANGITRMEFEPHLSLSATNPYLVSGETTDLVVSLVDGFGSPVDGENVTVSDGTSVYTGITDNNGQYVKTGVTVSSDTTFTASYKDVSDVCNVEYCLFKDYAVTGKSNYTAFYNYATFNPQVTDDGTLLTNNVATTYNYFANLGSTSDLYDFNPPFTVEFDIVSFSGTTIGTQITESGGNGAIRTFSQLGITQPCHLKLIVTGTQIIYQVDNETVMTQNYTVTQGRVSLIMNSATLKYKNFRIREG